MRAPCSPQKLGPDWGIRTPWGDHGYNIIDQQFNYSFGGFFDPVDVPDIGMIERCEHFSLALESRQTIRVRRDQRLLGIFPRTKR